VTSALNTISPAVSVNSIVPASTVPLKTVPPESVTVRVPSPISTEGTATDEFELITILAEPGKRCPIPMELVAFLFAKTISLRLSPLRSPMETPQLLLPPSPVGICVQV